MIEDPYITNFSIPETIKTIRDLQKALNRDILLLSSILFIVIFFPNTILPVLNFSLCSDLNSYILLLLLTPILYFSIQTHVYKLFIFARRIDNEVKDLYKKPIENTSPVNQLGLKEFMENTNVSTHRPTISISDNFISDLIIYGTNRLPSIRKLVLLSISIILFSLVIIYLLLMKIYVLDIYFVIAASTVIVLLVFHLYFNMYFIKRSAFLGKGEIVKQLCNKAYITLLLIKGLMNYIEHMTITKTHIEKINECIKTLEYLDKYTLLDYKYNIDKIIYVCNIINEVYNEFSQDVRTSVNERRKHMLSITYSLQDLDSSVSDLNSLIKKRETYSRYNYVLEENHYPGNNLSKIGVFKFYIIVLKTKILG